MPNELLGTFSTVLIIDHAAAVGYNDTAVLITMTPISVIEEGGTIVTPAVQLIGYRLYGSSCMPCKLIS